MPSSGLVLDPHKREKYRIHPSLLVLFFTSGVGSMFNKLFQKYALQEYKNHFLLAAYFLSLLIGIVLFLKGTNKSFTIRASLIGVVMGLCNMLGNFFLLKALHLFQASVVFPVYSAGSIVYITLMSFLLFHERLNRNQAAAISLTVGALILINL